MITVLTPTFNRKHTLPRLYESLKKQRATNFEWVIVDDGSNDGTEELLSCYSNEKYLNIKIINQKNSGKHSAINSGLGRSEGDFIFIVDSDDFLSVDAIERITADVSNTSSYSVVGHCYRKAFLNGALVGREINDPNPMAMTPTEASRFFKGDLAYVFRKDVMQKNPFPMIGGEKFVPELFIWNRISDMGKIIYYPKDAIYFCEYMPDGYTANFRKNLRRNPKGFGLFYRAQFFREPKLDAKIKCLIRSFQCFFYDLLNDFKA